MNPSRRKNQRKAKRATRKQTQVENQTKAESRIKYDTYPPQFGDKSSRAYSDRLLLAARDFTANAITAGATSGRFEHFFIDSPFGQDWLFFGHNGTDLFTDQDDIRDSCRICKTGGDGFAMFGQGMKYLASNMVGDPLATCLVVAGKCKDGQFRVAIGRPDPIHRRRWLIEDGDTVFWRQMIEGRCGPKIFADQTVFYLCRTDPRGKTTAFNYTSSETMNSLTHAASGFFGDGFNLEFGEKQIGRPAYPPSHRGGSSDRQVQKYSSIDMAIAKTDDADKRAGSGASSRPVVTVKEFDERYRRDDGFFLVKCEPFEVIINRNPERFLSNIQAEIEFRLYEGKYKNDPVKRSPWIANVRNGTSSRGNAFKEGRGSAPGVKPNQTAFLITPYAALGTDNNVEYQRYLHNAVYWLSCEGIMRTMGLPYIENFRKHREGHAAKDSPFVVVTIRINDIGNRHIPGDKKRDILDRIEPCSPHVFEVDCGCRPDFTIDTESGNSLVLGAAEAARGNLPDQLKDILTEMFPISDEQWVPLGEGGKTTTASLSEYEVISLKTGMKFEGSLALDSSVALAFRHRNTGKIVSAGDVKISSMTRGVELVAMSDKNVEHFLGKESKETLMTLRGDN